MAERLSEAERLQADTLERLALHAERMREAFPPQPCAQCLVLRGERDEARQQVEQLAGDLHAMAQDYTEARQQANANATAAVLVAEQFRSLQGACAQLKASTVWAKKQLVLLVSEDDGYGAFIRGTGTELAGFGAGMQALRGAIEKTHALLTAPPVPSETAEETSNGPSFTWDSLMSEE